MEELKKLTQPYGDDDDFYEGAQGASFPSNNGSSNVAASNFEDSFADQSSGRVQEVPKQTQRKTLNRQQVPQQMPMQQMPMQQPRGGRNFRQPQRQAEPQVVLFNPKNFDEAGELATYLSNGRSMVMALEGIPTETARRLLDFISGIAFALNAKITPVSAKTYFVTPANVDLLDSSLAQAAAEAKDDRF